MLLWEIFFSILVHVLCRCKLCYCMLRCWRLSNGRLCAYLRLQALLSGVCAGPCRPPRKQGHFWLIQILLLALFPCLHMRFVICKPALF